MKLTRIEMILWGVSAAALVNVALGIWVHSLLLVGTGIVVLAWVAVRTWLSRKRGAAKGGPAPPSSNEPPRTAATPSPAPAETDTDDTEALVRDMLHAGRYALLLRPQIAANLDDEQLSRAREALETGMALVPDGEVVLGQIDDALDDGELDAEEIAACRGRVIRVAHLFLDRYPVTNRQFHEFVAAGGYEQSALWDPSILPAVLDFVDRTGQPGPAFWRDGRFEPGKGDHPVVGVSWFEAAAFARWVGKRLPTDAEWVKAGAWPVPLSATKRTQRRYPWGESMLPGRANLWAAGRDDTVAVHEFAEGTSVGGVCQLIGNVWEWTRGDFNPDDLCGEDLDPEAPLKSIRGGAFDTYFENHATCQFQSGESAVARKHNIGFRCALSICDLMLQRPPAAVPDDATPSLEEVCA